MVVVVVVALDDGKPYNFWLQIAAKKPREGRLFRKSDLQIGGGEGGLERA